ncbi:MAG TPA: DUF4159 domain-containing protein [Bryobacteraceae bacterium]|nr:DUF4159 domain-containing protein [Bryobacteraceae bacterium]
MLRPASLIAALLLFLGGLYAFQRPFRQFPGVEYETFPLPPDWNEQGEWTFARLMYPWNGWGFHYGDDWTKGSSNWTIDYPRSDRHLAQAMRRLTRIHVRSVEQPVNFDEGDQYDWPWLYGVEVGHWALTDSQVKAFREYLLRGGFFMCDDFHGTQEWQVFEEGMKRVFPDRPILEIADDDPIFHSIYDLTERYQVPGAQYLYSHQLWEKDGREPRWRGIYDDRGRLMVAICHNMDLGDSWEHADNPQYPVKFSDLGIRIGVNYVVYAMTH